MLNFESDYITGCHPLILKRLEETNMEPQSGYGTDDYTRSAAAKIRAACGCPEAEVEFTVGGTQTNQLVIAAMLGSTDGVIAADTGHISVHESGAIELTGHKVICLPHEQGKLKAGTVRECLENFYADGNHEHMVFPGMVYISHPTEYGTLYSLAELTDLREVCTEYGIPLFLDGARLGYGLMSRYTDVTLKDIARLTDVFYIGGTKVGAICGEAVVFTKNNRPERFFGIKKQHGALLAKGRLLGLQFDTLFTDNLFFEISKNAIDRAEEMKEVFRERGLSFYIESPTNQQFVVLENSYMERLAKKVRFSFWEKADQRHTAVRFAVCWSTKTEDIEKLRQILKD